MGQILMSKRDEFNYPDNSTNSRSLAVKQLASFYEGVDKKTQLKAHHVTVSTTISHYELKVNSTNCD